MKHIEHWGLPIGNYPITHNLFVVVKQTGQTEQQTMVADANLLFTEQEQEPIAQTRFVQIRWHLLLIADLNLTLASSINRFCW